MCPEKELQSEFQGKVQHTTEQTRGRKWQNNETKPHCTLGYAFNSLPACFITPEDSEMCLENINAPFLALAFYCLCLPEPFVSRKCHWIEPSPKFCSQEFIYHQKAISNITAYSKQLPRHKRKPQEQMQRQVHTLQTLGTCV